MSFAKFDVQVTISLGAVTFGYHTLVGAWCNSDVCKVVRLMMYIVEALRADQRTI